MAIRLALPIVCLLLLVAALPAGAEIPPVCHDAYGHEDAAKAVELWTKCLEEKLDDSTRGIALFNRARRRMDLAQPQKAVTDKEITKLAIDDYTEAATFMRTDADVYINRGHAYMLLEDTENAHSDFSRAIALNPKDADAYANRAVVNIKQDKLVDAVYDLEKAVEINPAHIDALRALATILAMDTNEDVRDGQRAVEVALRLVNLSETWETLEILAAAHAEAEQFAQAVETQKKALELARAEEAGTTILEKNLERYQRNRKYY